MMAWLLRKVPPEAILRMHAVAMDVWLLLAIPTILLWKESVLWVAFMSLWANFASHWAAEQAVRAEMEAKRGS